MNQECSEFKNLIARINDVGESVILHNATDVDQSARFPKEAIDELKKLNLMSCLISKEYSGLGLTLTQVSEICSTLGTYCSSTALIFAMHQMNMSILMRNFEEGNQGFIDLLKDIVEKQLLTSSSTTEMNIGGDNRKSACFVELDGERFRLKKVSPVISYAKNSDLMFITARRNEDSSPSDQVCVIASLDDCELDPLNEWDTLGFRGTSSSGYTVTAVGNASSILSTPFSEILNNSMQPVSHILWCSVWFGMARRALDIARKEVVARSKKGDNSNDVALYKIANMSAQLTTMKDSIDQNISGLEAHNGQASFMDRISFSMKINELKVVCSRLLIEVVSESMMIVGINAYRNTGKNSLARLLRDSYGAPLMVSNDRLLQNNTVFNHLL